MTLPFLIQSFLGMNRFCWGVYLIHPPKVLRKEDLHEARRVNLPLHGSSILCAKS